MNVLVIDVGGNNVKLLATGEEERRKFSSGPGLSATAMVEQVAGLTADWRYDRVSLGYPGPVIDNKIVFEPRNLGTGWLGFDFEAAFDRPVKLINDAAMQALGGYRGGRMLFLGFGTGLGTAMVIDGIPIATELSHLPFEGSTYEKYVGRAALKRLGPKKWSRRALAVIEYFREGLYPEDILLGGGNVKKLPELPPG
ncbi:MAG: ROK family protein, partial [Pseudomonadota bacterium]